MLEGAERAAISYPDSQESGDFLTASTVSANLSSASGEHSQPWGLLQGRDVDSELFTLGSEH